MCKVLSSTPSTVRQKQNKQDSRIQQHGSFLNQQPRIILAKCGIHGMHQPYIWSLIFQLLQQTPHSPKFVFYVKHFRMYILLITISWVIFCTVYRYLKLTIFIFCDSLYCCIGGEFFAEMQKDWILLPTAESSNENRTLTFCTFFQFPCRVFFFYSLVLAKRVFT